MSYWRTGVLTLALAVLTIAGPLAGAATEIGSEVVPGTYDRVAAEIAQAELSNQLIELEGVLPEAVIAKATAEQLQKLAEAPDDQGRLLVGTNIEIGLVADGEAVSGFGTVRETDQGKIWVGVVQAPQAKAIRLHFSQLNLPKGAELFVYNDLGEAFGPYTKQGPLGDGELWAHTLRGSEARIQVHFGQGIAASARGGQLFVLEQAVHLGDKFLFAILGDPTEAFCSFNASCVQNAECSSIPSAIQATRNAMAHLQFAVGSSTYICSGGLLNDTDTSTQIPYLLTANHCFSSASSASSLEAYFQFSTSCGGSCYNPNGAVPRTVGSTIMATNSSSDYTLVRLSGSLPSGSVLLGWNATAVANSSGTSLYRISHPKGAPQAYSTHSVNTTSGTCSGIPRGGWIYSDDTFGATEGGSSGSVVMNSSGQVVGQLTGACGASPSTPCDGDDRTIDGALAAYFSSVQSYLDPGTGGGGCSGGTQYSGSLSSGGSSTHGQGTKSGTITGSLSCSGPDFDLYLDKQSCSWWSCSWSTVASSTSTNCSESINYSGSSGTYRWRV
ncbi:MAG: serine protease, partial [Acidobacteriota bacterium]|nr:serine protease [Acidobacteriota bacterium]